MDLSLGCICSQNNRKDSVFNTNNFARLLAGAGGLPNSIALQRAEPLEPGEGPGAHRNSAHRSSPSGFAADLPDAHDRHRKTAVREDRLCRLLAWRVLSSWRTVPFFPSSPRRTPTRHRVQPPSRSIRGLPFCKKNSPRRYLRACALTCLGRPVRRGKV
jgi:hypothetical protein